MIRIVTFEREYGSGAADIAANVAEQLGWKLWDQILTDQIARHLHCDQRHVEQQEERRDPLHYRLFKAFLRGSFEGNLASARGVQLADAEGIRQVSEKLVRAAAEEGKVVIVGRGSAYYLHERPDAFHVFIYGPFEEKVRRIQRQGKSEKEAMELVKTVDNDRADFIKQNFGVDWPQRQYFDLMVNSVVGEETAGRIILNALAAMNQE